MLVERLLRIALLGSSWVMYLLLLLSVFSIAAMVERLAYFRRFRGDVDTLTTELLAKLRRGDKAAAQKLLDASQAVEAKVVGAALAYLDGGPEAFSDAVEGQLGKQKKDLERGMGYLGTLGSNAPFIGLFGTVIGVIEAFHQLGDGANKAAMGNVMSGIAEALVATGVGLFVAIPAVVAYNMLQSQIGSIETNVASITKQITATIKLREVVPADMPSTPSISPERDSEIPEERVSSATLAEAE